MSTRDIECYFETCIQL